MLAQADQGLDEDGHPATEHGDPTDVAGEIADEFGGAGGAMTASRRLATTEPPGVEHGPRHCRWGPSSA